MKRLIILDLDHTAFDTDKFMGELAQAAEGNWIESRVFRLPRPRGSAAWFAAMLWLITRFGRVELPADNRFVCTDVEKFLADAKAAGYDVIILTTGFGPWQSYKRQISPILQTVPFKAVMRNKAYFLRRHLRNAEDKLEIKALVKGAYDEIMLIDDLPDTFVVYAEGGHEIPDNFKLVRLRREGDRYSGNPSPSFTREVIGLADVLK